MKDNRLEEMRRNYNDIPIPVDLKKRVEESIQQAKNDTETSKMKKHIPIWTKFAAGAVAAMLVLTVLVNTNNNIAYAMSDIPVLGAIIKVVTFSTYEDKNQDMSAHIETPRVTVESKDGHPMEEAADKLNKSVKDYTNQVIEQYKADVKATGGEGYEEVTTDYEVVTDNDKLFSLRVNTVIMLNSSGITIKIYHIDKSTGQLMTLPDLFKDDSDYTNVISEEIKRQMRQQMAADENIAYFIDEEDMPGLNWTGITDEANFYFDKDGSLTFVFDKYEAAPGYMGVCEFKIPKDITNKILLDKFAE